MKKIGLLSACLFLLGQAFGQLSVSLEDYATGFDNPVDIAHCGDDRLFIVERSGTIRIIDGSGNILPTPFLNIESQVNDSPNEQGMLGLAFHPDYLNNGLFYVNYTINTEDTRVSSFKVSDNDINVADEDSELILLEQNQPFWNHNGGCMKFGPDGYLYISIGDGGSGNDPQMNSQNTQSLLGKMLRIDVDGGSPYAIPPDNPFVNDPQTLDEIWAIGLRNLWRFSIDEVTGDIWMGDVGQNAREEVNFQPAGSPGGENYGWRCYEGNIETPNPGISLSECPPSSELTFPVMDYVSGFSQGFSVTGGMVYRGCEFPEMYGHYIFADYGTGKFWRISPDGNGGWENDEIADLNNNQMASFGTNSSGQLFVAQHGNGRISKVVSSGELLAATDETCDQYLNGTISFTIPTGQFASVMWSDGSTDANRTDLAPGDYEVTVTTVNGCEFTGAASVDNGPMWVPAEVMMDGDTLLFVDDSDGFDFQWFLDGNPIAGANSSEYEPEESGQYYVVFMSGGCEITSTTVDFTVSNVLNQLSLNSFSLSPNPFANELTLQLSASRSMNFEVVITDLNGKELERHQENLSSSFSKVYDLSSLTSGFYLFNLKTDKGEWSERILKK